VETIFALLVNTALLPSITAEMPAVVANTEMLIHLGPVQVALRGNGRTTLHLPL
jgi:hypothetical protein